MKTKDLAIAAFALILVGALGALWLAPAGLSRAPDVRMVTVDGREIALAELRGAPLLVTFWATSCPSCVHEIPHLKQMYTDYGPRGLKVLGIAMHYDPPEHVTEMIRVREINYPISIDTTAEAARAFGDVKLTPTTFLIAPDGRIVHQKIGDLDIPMVRRTIENMLDAGAAGRL
jgi:peroxiredoxin